MVKDYTSVSVSNKLLELIDEVVESDETTYKTRSDFIKDAVRIRLRDLGKKI